MNLSNWLTILLAIEVIDIVYGKRAKSLGGRLGGGMMTDCESKEEFNNCKEECDDNRDCNDRPNLNCGAECKGACKIVTQDKAECEAALMSYLSKWRGRVAWDEDDDIPKHWDESRSYYPSVGGNKGDKKKHSKKRKHKHGGGKKHKKRHHGGGHGGDDDDDDDDDDKKDKNNEEGIDKYGPGGGSGGGGNKSPFDSSKYSQGDAENAGQAGGEEEQPKKGNKFLGKVRDTVRWAQSPVQKTVTGLSDSLLKDERSPVHGVLHSKAGHALSSGLGNSVSRMTGKQGGGSNNSPSNDGGDSGGGSSNSGGGGGGGASNSNGSPESSGSGDSGGSGGGGRRKGGLLGTVGRGLGGVAHGVGGVLG